MAATDVQNTIHDLEAAGADPKLAAAIAHRLERRTGPSAMSILIAATLAGFGLLAIGIGWVRSDIGELRTEIAANRDRIDNVSERLTRIETLLEERLPERR